MDTDREKQPASQIGCADDHFSPVAGMQWRGARHPQAAAASDRPKQNATSALCSDGFKPAHQYRFGCPSRTGLRPATVGKVDNSRLRCRASMEAAFCENNVRPTVSRPSAGCAEYVAFCI